MQLPSVMRTQPPHLIRVALGLALIVTPAVALTSAAPSPGDAAAPVAVVELFTSEGCSSCPPADALLGQLAAETRDKHLSVYCLAFHVDYWDRLGWKDPFSAAAYSERQWAYARAANSQDVYTPEMIVNGTDAFVGSDRARAARSIESALARAAKVKVGLRPVSEDGSTATFSFAVTGAPKGAVLHVAAVEGGLVSQVARGENSGRVLRHENVVRSFVTVSLKDRSEGTISVPIPPAGAAQPISVIAFVQAPSMAILGATEAAPGR